jgi:hypothetical protein
MTLGRGLPLHLLLPLHPAIAASARGSSHSRVETLAHLTTHCRAAASAHQPQGKEKEKYYAVKSQVI